MDEARLRALIHMSITEMRIRIFAGVEMDEACLRALIHLSALPGYNRK